MSLGPLESETCRDYVVPRLASSGWGEDLVIEQYPITDGRIIPGPRRYRRERRLRVDYLLQYQPGFAVAVVEAKREYKRPGDGLGQAKRYAGLLDLPLAYSTNGKGIVEHDFDTGVERDVDRFCSPEEAWERYRGWKGLTDERQVDALLFPFTRALRNPDGSVKEPRYYQRVAIARAVEAATRGQQRALITMATGTGKTFVAMQIVWKLWSTGWKGARKPRILYLADRNILVDQPIQREFVPAFGNAVWKIQGEAKMGREVYFALYQSLADTGDALGIFRDYPTDYFDLVIVDECHRGGARDESAWRSILEHFGPATQLGMTATPLRSENVDTYRYFGNPIYEYSLKQGIDDGFLAPYRVRRVVLSPDAHGFPVDQGQLDLFGKEIPAGLYETRHFERVVSLLTRTEAAARHLTDYLRKTDSMAKTIVFCVDSEHADQMRRAMNNQNADLARQHPDYVVRIVALEGDVGMEHLGRFADPDSSTPVIATTSRLLSTGVDIPTARNIVLFKPIGSMVEFKQIIGRGSRLYPDEDKLTFEIIDYSGATALFEDPDFDGPPQHIVEEEINEEGDVVDVPLVASPEPSMETGAAAELEEEDLEERRAEKFYVGDVEVFLVAEGFYLPDPSSGKLRLVEYADYVADAVRRLSSDPADLRSRWRSQDGRDALIDELASRGISIEELLERTELTEADPLDVLVHVAWNEPALTRRDRLRRLRDEHADFLRDFVPEARAILEALLEKYAEFGPAELSLEGLTVPPLTSYGTPVEIAERFGGAEGLKAAVEDLQGRLYAA